MNKIVCGDAFELIKNIPDKSVDLIVTDPPYLLKKINKGGTVNDVKKLNKSLQELEAQNLINGYDIEEYGKEFLRVMKTPNIYIWCNKAQIPLYLDFYVTKHKCKFDIITWHKPNALPTYANKYLTDTEYLLYFHKGKGKCFPECYEDAKTYYVAPINHKDKKKYGHPTIKPLDFTMRLIRNSSKEGDLVFDPFLGSGTTAIASLSQGRRFLGYELNSDYVSLSVSRLSEYNLSCDVE